MYCEKCNRLFRGSEALCPVCGSRKIREPWADDFCFLTEKGSPWGEMLAKVLGDNGVSFLKQPVLGAGVALNLGAGMERYRFYVRYAQLDQARELLERLFPKE